MDMFAWLGFICYVLAFLIVVLFAISYLKRSDFMPYHREAVGRPWAEIEPRVQVLLMALIKVAGAGWLALAMAGTMLAYALFFLGKLAIPQLLAFQAFCLIATVPPVAVAARVRKLTGAHTPITAGALVVGLCIAGFVLATTSLLRIH